MTMAGIMMACRKVLGYTATETRFLQMDTVVADVEAWEAMMGKEATEDGTA